MSTSPLFIYPPFLSCRYRFLSYGFPTRLTLAVKTDALPHDANRRFCTALIIVDNLSPITEEQSEKVLVKRLVAQGRGADIVDSEICARTRVECESSVCFVWIFPILFIFALALARQHNLSSVICGIQASPVQWFHSHICVEPLD